MLRENPVTMPKGGSRISFFTFGLFGQESEINTINQAECRRDYAD